MFYNQGMMKKYLPLIYIGIIVLFLFFASLTRSEPEVVLPVATVADFGMSLPENYREDFILYLVVDRVDHTVRHIYADPSALEAIEADEELPYGTQIIIETWDAQRDFFGNLQYDSDGHLVAGEMRPNIHMMEKRIDWTNEQLASPIGVIDWNFGSFDSVTMLASTENRNDCLTCHDGGAFRRDFVFSRQVIEDFVNDESEVQYLYCSLPERGNCIR
ncbi:MAG: hypothetical protein Phog2KO_44130 [Phototrophicaceae bacterium]